MTTRIVLAGALIALLASGCNALKLVSGDRQGLPCNDTQGCGEGYACVDGVCVKDGRDGGAGDAVGHDGASQDVHRPDAASPDSTSPPPWDLTVVGSGFGMLTNTQVIGVLLDPGGVIAGSRVSVIGSFGTFTLQWPAALQPATSYRVRFFFDLNADGQCEYSPPPPDQSELGFEVAVGEATGPRTVTVTSGPGLMPRDVCDSFDAVSTDAGMDGGAGFDLTIQGSGFNSYLGQVLHLELFAGTPPALVASDTVTVSQPSFTTTLPGVLDSEQEYTLSWWFDSDASAECSQDDMGAQVYIVGVSADHVQTISSDAAAPYGCLRVCDLDKDFVDSSTAQCMGNDCDDDDNQRYPGNLEICGDGIDQDCSGADSICDGGGLDGGPQLYDLNVSLVGFTAGADYELLVYDDDDPGADEGKRHSGTLGAAGEDTASFSQVLVEGHAYTVLLFLDDGNAVCTIPPDQAFAFSISAVSASVSLSLTVASATGIDCGPIVSMHMASAPPWGDHNIVFVTSTTIGSEDVLTDLTGADAFCQSLANAAALPPQQYKAWLSTAGALAPNRLAADLGWVRPDGQAFAVSKAELLSGKVLAPPMVDEGGATFTQVTPVFTGTRTDGTSDANCVNWTDTNGVVAVGTMTGGTMAWTSNNTAPCSTPAHIYCFGNLTTAAQVQAPTTTGFRLAFVSAAAFSVSGGLSAADAHCATEGVATPDGYSALLAGTGTSAVSRLFANGADWVRMDGVKVLAGALDGSLPGLLAPLNVTADLQYLDNSGAAWTGADLYLPGTDASTCGEWNSQAGSTRVGRVNHAGLTSTDAFDRACNTANIRLYCFEN